MVEKMRWRAHAKKAVLVITDTASNKGNYNPEGEEAENKLVALFRKQNTRFYGMYSRPPECDRTCAGAQMERIENSGIGKVFEYYREGLREEVVTEVVKTLISDLMEE